MSRTNERTLKMMHEFLSMRERGLTISEIAKEFSLSETTVYSKLGEIARKAGVSRESLLQKPFEADHSGRNFTPVKPVDTAKFKEHFESAIKEIDVLEKIVNEAIEEQETIRDILMEDFKYE